MLNTFNGEKVGAIFLCPSNSFTLIGLFYIFTQMFDISGRQVSDKSRGMCMQCHR